MKKLFAVSMAFAMVMGLLTGCGSSGTQAEPSEAEAPSAADNAGTNTPAADDTSAPEAEQTAQADGTTYRIGVIQLVEHAALDATNEGFIAALDDAGISYVVDQQNAQGDQSACQTIAEKLVNDQNDLIFAIATPAAQAVAGATKEIPILVSAVTDPADAGLVASNENPGGNVSGTSDLTPVAEQIELLQQILPDAKKVGILYCSAEANSEFQANMAKEACDAAGLEYEIFTVSASNEIPDVVESMCSKVDVIYAPTDNMIAAGMTTVAMVATDNGIPIICGEENMVNAGGLATYGIDYYELGYMAGQQAVDILVNGADISTMPIGYLPAEKCARAANGKTAEALNIDLIEFGFSENDIF